MIGQRKPAGAANAITESGAREVEERRRCSAWKAVTAAARTVGASSTAAVEASCRQSVTQHRDLPLKELHLVPREARVRRSSLPRFGLPARNRNPHHRVSRPHHRCQVWRLRTAGPMRLRLTELMPAPFPGLLAATGLRGHLPRTGVVTERNSNL